MNSTIRGVGLGLWLALQRHFVSRGASMNHRCRPGPPTRRRLGAAGLQNVAVVLGASACLMQTMEAQTGPVLEARMYAGITVTGAVSATYTCLLYTSDAA